jgi:hypothetical protein
MKTMFRSILLVLLAGLSITASFGLMRPYATQVVTPLVPDAKTDTDVLEGLKKLSKGEIQALIEKNRAVLSMEPLQRESLQNILTLESLSGQKDVVEKQALALAAYSRRSVSSQLAAFQLDIAKRDYASAMSRIDGVLRARVDLHPQLLPILVSLSNDANGRTALASTLSRDPPWRGALLNDLIKQHPDGALAHSIFSEIRKTNGDIRDSEKQSVLRAMMKEKRFDAAYFLWLDFLTKAELLQVRAFYDGAFQLAPRNLFFDWNLPPRKNGRLQIGNRPGSSQDQVLVLDLYDDKQGGPLVFQYLRLLPGPHKISFEQFSEKLKSERGLVWRVSCAESGTLLGQSKVILEDGPWEAQSFDIAVPEQDCLTQYMRLESYGTTVLDRQVSGRLMFDGFTTKLGGETDPKVDP